MVVSTKKRARGKAFEPKPEAVWNEVERMYREGVLSNRNIVMALAEQGVSITETAIRKRATKEGWVKGEAHAIRLRAHQKADDLSLPRIVPPTAERVEELADLGSQIIVKHRRATATMLGLTATMVEQLQDQTLNGEQMGARLQAYYEHLAAENPLLAHVYKDQLNRALHAIGLNARSKTLVNITNAAKVLMDLERRSWNLDQEQEIRTYEDVLAEIHAAKGAA